jgi:hypothetical protein
VEAKGSTVGLAYKKKEADKKEGRDNNSLADHHDDDPANRQQIHDMPTDALGERAA